MRLYSEGGELRDRDPLVIDETEYEQALHPQPGGSLRYIPIPTSAEPDPDSDEELLDNFQAGKYYSLSLLACFGEGTIGRDLLALHCDFEVQGIFDFLPCLAFL